MKKRNLSSAIWNEGIILMANIFVWSQLEIHLSLHLTTYVEDINLTLQKVQLSVSDAFSIAPSLNTVPLVTVLCSHKLYRTSHRNWSIKRWRSVTLQSIIPLLILCKEMFELHKNNNLWRLWIMLIWEWELKKMNPRYELLKVYLDLEKGT